MERLLTPAEARDKVYRVLRDPDVKQTTHIYMDDNGCRCASAIVNDVVREAHGLKPLDYRRGFIDTRLEVESAFKFLGWGVSTYYRVVYMNDTTYSLPMIADYLERLTLFENNESYKPVEAKRM